jgi:hypothetical protein
MTDCERTALYFDGELPAEDEEAVLSHLAGCAACQAEIGDWMGIEVALSRGANQPAAVAAAPPPAEVPAGGGASPARSSSKPVAAQADDLAKRRASTSGKARSRWARIAAIAVPAAAVIALAMWWVARPGTEPVAIALAETRSVEPRLSAAAFDHYRPYRVSRDIAVHELIPLKALAELEHRGDTAGLAAAHVLGGELARAEAALAAAPASPARDSDRAAIALIRGEPAAALALIDAAIAASPALASAHWNRALALQALDLPLAAAVELDGVAAGSDPGWSADARDRAKALRAPLVARAAEPGAAEAAERDARALAARAEAEQRAGRAAVAAACRAEQTLRAALAPRGPP